ncbi:hypothetical protein QVD17_26236 [Tagetes erecta]|uniref:Uncharacterized protein n=1 Tax=Tagetes erecta TaxID=13708 RepID=A0AAD8K677_TARER|nr:hypothetical protein QVD17_26236 [Tagetes erecta]
MGPYTVFITHPSDAESPIKNPPPVQPPPLHYHNSDSPKFAFFWDAVAKLQNAHSSLDEYVAHWFGLNQSKYQWALDDYYESNGSDKVDTQDGVWLRKNTFIMSFEHVIYVSLLGSCVGLIGSIYMILGS